MIYTVFISGHREETEMGNSSLVTYLVEVHLTDGRREIMPWNSELKGRPNNKKLAAYLAAIAKSPFFQPGIIGGYAFSQRSQTFLATVHIDKEYELPKGQIYPIRW